VNAQLTIKVGDLEVDPFNGEAVRMAAERVAAAQLASVPENERGKLLEAAVTIAFEHFIALGNAIHARTQVGLIDDQLETLQQALGSAFGFISSAEPDAGGAQLEQGPQIYVPDSEC
jgi:hypothetical protein